MSAAQQQSNVSSIDALHWMLSEASKASAAEQLGMLDARDFGTLTTCRAYILCSCLVVLLSFHETIRGLQ